MITIDFRGLLSHKDYVLFWFATAFSDAANYIFQYVLALYVLKLTGSSTAYATLISIVVIPKLFLTPLAGVFGDRYQKPKIMAVMNGLQILAFGAFAVAFRFLFSNSFPLTVAMVVILEVLNVFYYSAEAAIMPELIPKYLLEDGVSFGQIDNGVVLALAPIIGAFVYENLSFSTVLLVLTGLVLCALLLTLFIKTPFAQGAGKRQVKAVDEDAKALLAPEAGASAAMDQGDPAALAQQADAMGVSEEARDSGSAPQGLMASLAGRMRKALVEFKEGLEELKRDRTTASICFMNPLIVFSSCIFNVMIAYVLLEKFKVSAYVFALYNFIVVLAMIVVPLLLTPLIKRQSPRKLIVMSSVVDALILSVIGAFIYYYFSAGVELKVALMVIVSLDTLSMFAWEAMYIGVSTYYQRNVKDDRRARVMSIAQTLVTAATALGTYLWGFLGDRMPTWNVFFLASASLAVTIVITIRVFQRNPA